MTPRSEALAYRIWAYCEPRGWDCTYSEIADALDVDVGRVGTICHIKGWRSRLRVSSRQVSTDAWGDGRFASPGGKPLSAFDNITGADQ